MEHLRVLSGQSAMLVGEGSSVHFRAAIVLRVLHAVLALFDGALWRNKSTAIWSHSGPSGSTAAPYDAGRIIRF